MSCGYTAPRYCSGLVCEQCEAFCQATTHEAGQAVSSRRGAANAPAIVRDDIGIKVFPKTELQRLMAYISGASNEGSRQNSGGWTGSPSEGNFILASDINNLLDGIRTLNNANPGANVAKDDVIYGTFFNGIMSAINSARFDTNACNNCNTGCNIDCRNCITCDSCMYSVCSDCDCDCY